MDGWVVSPSWDGGTGQLGLGQQLHSSVRLPGDGSHSAAYELANPALRVVRAVAQVRLELIRQAQALPIKVALEGKAPPPPPPPKKKGKKKRRCHKEKTNAINLHPGLRCGERGRVQEKTVVWQAGPCTRRRWRPARAACPQGPGDPGSP